jgi:dTDP-glucose 4,6-dehydratase
MAWGSQVLLQETLRYWRALIVLEAGKAERFRLHHLSTDEVFGSLERVVYFNED